MSEPWNRDAYEAVIDGEYDDEPRALPIEACGACGRAITGTRVRQAGRVVCWACWVHARESAWNDGEPDREAETEDCKT